jgi:hypothetical protein
MRETSMLRGTRTALMALAIGGLLPGVAAAQETDASIVADAVRDHGFACEEPVSASRDPADSAPDEAAWILQCKQASYRVKFIGSERKTEVEPLG